MFPIVSNVIGFDLFSITIELDDQYSGKYFDSKNYLAIVIYFVVITIVPFLVLIWWPLSRYFLRPYKYTPFGLYIVSEALRHLRKLKV